MRQRPAAPRGSRRPEPAARAPARPAEWRPRPARKSWRSRAPACASLRTLCPSAHERLALRRVEAAPANCLHSGALEISPIEELFVLMRVGRLAADSKLGHYYT